ncbi:MAG: peroxiredoxin Q/BCP [archaeon GW2011_AR17]|nr:MAG: peroxiredoxin Q/BCP [archaeon GW2011_AR17]MBS3153766.1 thioredoxin-dependent thiol peroxidase [Candidatus Woesearchaeota archaeon]HIH15207.1 thioredoxin-dependent thiol peroxidase [Nanoarchaeota archaeon]HIH59473.1 thioredoxin-dependent thiol peroxidase [Nanoarchaeota archaeon]HII13871.1 thioredoxin-dependent thiol peroxidase [Nanoarchaeota archaeon]
MLKEGTEAPDFQLKDAKGKECTLSQYKGKKVILYFYPKDDTPGCTKEACDFRDNIGIVANKKAVVLGISADSEASHGKFTQKFGLPFTLLSDPEKKVIQAYKAWGEKSMYGRKYMGIFRTTYVIDEKGKILKSFENVKVPGHVEEVLSLL